MTAPQVIDSRHPNWVDDFSEWEKWRLTYSGGDAFRVRYLEKFDSREDETDFKTRRRLTPLPLYAKAAINDVRNSIFQRLVDVNRHSGSDAYMRSVSGEDGGVDRRGSSMNYFLGDKPLTDLLVMGRVGIFVDMPEVYGPTLAHSRGEKPYLYMYQAEDILNWSQANPEDPSEFSSILLRDTALSFDQTTWMPTHTVRRFRHMWISPETGLVNVQFLSEAGDPIDQNGAVSGPIELELTKIPFVMLDIGDSLLKDVADHQIALMNLCSSDVNYALRSNFTFYTEQRDLRAVGDHLKRVASDGSAQAGGQGAGQEVAKVGVTQGRYYDLNAERPGFIAPPSDPLKVSLQLQEKLEQDIRKLINLAVVDLGARASAESKKKDKEGLEAGLSYIGLVLEGAERKIANYWAAYENRVESRRQIAVIKYPDTYSLKTDQDRTEQAQKLSELMFAVPGQTVKREIAKGITTVLLSGKIKTDTMEQIHREIDRAQYTTSDPQTIIDAKEAGLVGEKTASMALGFTEQEYLQARIDHVERLKRIAEVQGVKETSNAASRGISDLDDEPQRSGSEEKEMSRATDLEDTTNPRVRGENQNERN